MRLLYSSLLFPVMGGRELLAQQGAGTSSQSQLGVQGTRGGSHTYCRISGRGSCTVIKAAPPLPLQHRSWALDMLISLELICQNQH